MSSTLNLIENKPVAEVKVLIAIQARTNSTRFPQKIYQTVGKKMVLDHVIDQAKSAKIYVERSTHKKVIKCDIAVLHPENDIQLMTTFRHSGAQLIAGSESDVLSRYVKAIRATKADYIVRLTSDCPLMLDFIISKHINVAVHNDLDYVSNVEESCRQVADGFDCEILSSRAIEWLNDNAMTDFEKEHVTVLLRSKKPNNLKQAFISSKLDSSHIKLSLDTPDDLVNIRKYYHEREHKMNVAQKNFGRKNVYEL